MPRMYWKHWGLASSPFKSNPDARDFLCAAPQDEALSRLDFLMRSEGPGGLLVGEAGVGKSLLLQVFSRELSVRGFLISRISVLGVDAKQFLWMFAHSLGCDVARNERIGILCRTIQDQIETLRHEQRRLALLIDNADQAGLDARSDVEGREVLIQIARLAQSQMFGGPRTTVILAARTQTASRIGPRLRELVELRMDVRPWSEAELNTYLRQSLERVGRHEPVFSAEATSRLYQLSGGVPRQVRQLADLALVAGAGQGSELIDADILDSVQSELGVLQPSAGA
jgi:general secretion pathway protein A